MNITAKFVFPVLVECILRVNYSIPLYTTHSQFLGPHAKRRNSYFHNGRKWALSTVSTRGVVQISAIKKNIFRIISVVVFIWLFKFWFYWQHLFSVLRYRSHTCRMFYKESNHKKGDLDHRIFNWRRFYTFYIFWLAICTPHVGILQAISIFKEAQTRMLCFLSLNHF